MSLSVDDVPSNGGLFFQAKGIGSLKTVGLNKVDIVEYGPDFKSIGTAGLGGCSVAVIVSRRAAILAHISPRPTAANAAHDGDEHMEQMMGQVVTLYEESRQLFPPEQSAVAVCAQFLGSPDNEIALPDQLEIMNRHFRGLEIAHSLKKYTISIPYGPEFPGKGTVFVDGSGDRPMVYVEDEIIQLPNRAPKS